MSETPIFTPGLDSVHWLMAFGRQGVVAHERVVTVGMDERLPMRPLV